MDPEDLLQLVRRGYDAIARRYSAARDRAPLPLLDDLVEHLHGNASVLDAGCGAGVPIAAHLASRGLTVSGLDLSAEQLRLAREAVGMALVQGDLRHLPFRSGSFDAAISTYAVFHVPRDRHSDVLAELRRVLTRPAYLLVTMGVEPWEGIERFHGREMFWSHFGRDENRDLVRAAGFRILKEEIDGTSGEKHAVFFAMTDGFA